MSSCHSASSIADNSARQQNHGCLIRVTCQQTTSFEEPRAAVIRLDVGRSSGF
jgi:hypothetical protein